MLYGAITLRSVTNESSFDFRYSYRLNKLRKYYRRISWLEISYCKDRQVVCCRQHRFKRLLRFTILVPGLVSISEISALYDEDGGMVVKVRIILQVKRASISRERIRIYSLNQALLSV